MAVAAELWEEVQGRLAALPETPEGERSEAVHQRLEDATEDLLANYERLKANQEALEEAFKRVRTALEHEVASGSVSLDLDDAIGTLEAHERNLKADLLPNIAKTEKHVRQVVLSMPAQKRGRAFRLHQNRLALMRRILEHSRDARWQLLCLRAELERDHTGPMFEDVDALEHYLDKL